MRDDSLMFHPQGSVLITGCSSGIGEAAARVLRGRNWRVFASARRKEDVDRLKTMGFEAVLIDYENPENHSRRSWRSAGSDRRPAECTLQQWRICCARRVGGYSDRSDARAV